MSCRAGNQRDVRLARISLVVKRQIERRRNGGERTVEKSSHCVLTTSLPTTSAICRSARPKHSHPLAPFTVYDWRLKTHPAHRFIQRQPNSLDRDIPLLSLGRGFEESPQDTSGDEASATDSDEQCGF